MQEPCSENSCSFTMVLARHIFKDKAASVVSKRQGWKRKKKKLQRDIIDIFPEAILAQKGLESLLISFKMLSKAALPRLACIPASQARVGVGGQE